MEKTSTAEDYYCSICSELYNGENLPKILNCSHMYCERCVMETLKSLPCPKCPSEEFFLVRSMNRLSFMLKKKGTKKGKGREDVEEVEDQKKEKNEIEVQDEIEHLLEDETEVKDSGDTSKEYVEVEEVPDPRNLEVEIKDLRKEIIKKTKHVMNYEITKNKEKIQSLRRDIGKMNEALSKPRRRNIFRRVKKIMGGKSHKKYEEHSCNKVDDQVDPETFESPSCYYRQEDEIDHPIINVHLASRMFTTTSSNHVLFLEKIYQKIQSGETLLTVQLSNPEFDVKYGSISAWNNSLFFHSLTLNDPNGCEEFVKFDDLKNVILSLKYDAQRTFRPFLKFGMESSVVEYVVQVEVINSSLLPQFVLLCTGESGFCYKKAEYRKTTTCIKVDNLCDLEDPNVLSALGFGIRFEDLVPLDRDNHYIIMDPLGGFEIFYTSENTSVNDCVGKIISPFPLLEVVKTGGTITDCGVSFQLE